MKCNYCHEKEATAGCIMCQKLICEDCTVSWDGQIYCKRCLVPEGSLYLGDMLQAPELYTFTKKGAYEYAKVVQQTGKDLMELAKKAGVDLREAKLEVFQEYAQRVITGNENINKFTAEPISSLPLLDAALELCIRTACDIAPNEFIRTMWTSWAVGGSSIFHFEGKETAFTKKPDNLHKSKLLLELGMQAMISWWFWQLFSERNVSRHEMDDVIEVGLLNIQTLLDVSSKDTLKLYYNFYKQLQPTLENEGKWLPFVYIDMFYQRYLECVAGEQTINWAKLSFPVKSHQQYSDSYHGGHHNFILNDAEKVISLWTDISVGAAGMFKHFNKEFKAE